MLTLQHLANLDSPINLILPFYKDEHGENKHHDLNLESICNRCIHAYCTQVGKINCFKTIFPATFIKTVCCDIPLETLNFVNTTLYQLGLIVK